MTKKIIHIDSSILRYSACSRALYLSLLKGYRTKLNPIAIEFGQAFHTFARLQGLNKELYKDNLNAARTHLRETPSIPHPKAKYFTDAYLCKVCDTWNDYHEQDAFNILVDPTLGPWVEKKFRIPFYEDDWCIIYLCGTIDKMCIHSTSKMLCVGDYKTTSTWEVDEYLKQYDLSGQLCIYTIALHHHINIATEDSILYKYKHLQTGAFIEGIFLSGGTKEKPEPVVVQRSDVRQASMMPLEKVKRILVKHCRNISDMIKEESCYNNILPHDEIYIPDPDGMLNGACTQFDSGFGNCKYFGACSSSDERSFQATLDRNFITKIYNPLQFN